MTKTIHIVIICICFLQIFPTFAQPGENHAEKISPVYFYEPYPISQNDYIIQLGGSFTLVPISMVENEYPVPTIDLQMKYGLSENFSINGVLSTLVVYNLLHGGIQWNTNFDRFSIGAANHIGGFGGYFNYEGQFDDNTAYATFYMPIIRLGYRFEDFSISMSFAASYIFNSGTEVGEYHAESISQTWNDFFCTITIEQPIFKESYITLGLSIDYARTPFQSWLVYNTFDHYLFVPEFFFAFQL